MFFSQSHLLLLVDKGFYQLRHRDEDRLADAFALRHGFQHLQGEVDHVIICRLKHFLGRDPLVNLTNLRVQCQPLLINFDLLVHPAPLP